MRKLGIFSAAVLSCMAVLAASTGSATAGVRSAAAKPKKCTVSAEEKQSWKDEWVRVSASKYCKESIEVWVTYSASRDGAHFYVLPGSSEDSPKKSRIKVIEGIKYIYEGVEHKKPV
jgi:hypothetical protein